MAGKEIAYRFDEMRKNAGTLRDPSEVATKRIGKIVGKKLPGDDEVLADLQSAYSMLCETVGATLKGTKGLAEFAATEFEEIVSEKQAGETDNAEMYDSAAKSLDEAAKEFPTSSTSAAGSSTTGSGGTAGTSAETGYNAPPVTAPATAGPGRETPR